MVMEALLVNVPSIVTASSETVAFASKFVPEIAMVLFAAMVLPVLSQNPPCVPLPAAKVTVPDLK